MRLPLRFIHRRYHTDHERSECLDLNTPIGGRKWFKGALWGTGEAAIVIGADDTGFASSVLRAVQVHVPGAGGPPYVPVHVRVATGVAWRGGRRGG